MLLAAIVLQALVGAQPDAVAIPIHFATAFARASTGAVALVFGTLRFRTEKRDVGQRTVSTILAVVEH